MIGKIGDSLDKDRKAVSNIIHKFLDENLHGLANVFTHHCDQESIGDSWKKEFDPDKTCEECPLAAIGDFYCFCGLDFYTIDELTDELTELLFQQEGTDESK